MKKTITVHTFSADETIGLGQKLGVLLTPGDVLALIGELGSGKTRFAKGVGLGLDVTSDTVITSPSFSLLNEYQGRCPFFHIDGYRLTQLSEFLSAGLEEYFYQDGVSALEWADRWPEILPEWTLEIKIAILEPQTRKITLSGGHPRVLTIIEQLAAAQ